MSDRIRIGKHTLDCQDQDGLQLSRFGDPRYVNVDGVHMKGSSGKVSFTRSLASILAEVGLCDREEAEQVCRSKQRPTDAEEFHTVQRGRRAAPSREGGNFQLTTSNQFEVLGN